jgi:large subunit ribosomal protein L6
VIEMENEFTVPENVTIEIDNKTVKVSGPKGSLEREFKHFFDIKITKKDNKLVVSSASDRKKVKAMGGTIIAHIRNMFKGVTEGYTYKMKIVYSHFPVTVKVEGDKVLVQNFLGENIPRVAKIVGDTKIEVKGQDVILTGPSKDDVGQTCGNIEIACKINKYDRRIFQDGVYVVEKE